MQEKQRDEKFYELFTGIAEMYGKDPSPAVYEIWFNSLNRFEYDEISKAFSIYIQNPDSGKFMPKPADVIKIIEGSGIDSAFIAWSKVEKAIRMVGQYESVVFDDPIIHRVIQDMGGWIRLCGSKENDLPFVANEFRRRYQGFKSQGQIPEYPPKLIGVHEGENRVKGFIDFIHEPTFIGNPKIARLTLLNGSDRPSLQITQSGGNRLKQITVGQLKCLN